MKLKDAQYLFTIMAITLTIIVASTMPAAATDSKNAKKSAPNPSAGNDAASLAHETTTAHTAGQYDSKPGPAWKTVGGTVKRIKGDVYTVEDYEDNQIQLYVSRETKKIHGNKKIGDPVRAEITRGGFANSIQ